MNKIMTLVKTKTRKMALLAGSFIVLATPLGMSAGASASSYGNDWNDNNSGYNSDWSYRSDNDRNNDYWSDGSYRQYSAYAWVYDPELHRWVLIGYNTHRDRWELVYSSDRYQSHDGGRNDDRNYSYWYND